MKVMGLFACVGHGNQLEGHSVQSNEFLRKLAPIFLEAILIFDVPPSDFDFYRFLSCRKETHFSLLEKPIGLKFGSLALSILKWNPFQKRTRKLAPYQTYCARRTWVRIGTRYITSHILQYLPMGIRKKLQS